MPTTSKPPVPTPQIDHESQVWNPHLGETHPSLYWFLASTIVTTVAYSLPIPDDDSDDGYKPWKHTRINEYQEDGEALGALVVAAGAVVGAGIFAVYNIFQWIQNQVETARLALERAELARQQVALRERQDHVQAVMEQAEEDRAGVREAMGHVLAGVLEFEAQMAEEIRRMEHPEVDDGDTIYYGPEPESEA